MSSLLTIDPGLKVVGWAYWEARELVCCGLSRTKRTELNDQAQEHRFNLASFWPADRRVCEQMVWRGKNAKSGPADLLKINIIAGRLADEWVTPLQWKGMVAKEIDHPRILAKLGEHELKIVTETKVPASLRHNMIDAVGIGLYVLGRRRT